MRYAILWVDKPFQNNRIFETGLNRDDCLYHYQLLKQKFRENGIELVTQDLCNIREAEFVIFNDLPPLDEYYKVHDVQYLILWESEAIRPWQWWQKELFKDFKKVFSWYDLFNEPNIVKYWWPQKMTGQCINKKTKKLCIVNNFNKKSGFYKELYSERINAIEYFKEKIHIYGLPNLPIANKLDVLKDYEFAICFENVKDLPGYVTEKIFDCFKSGVIPIYWGNNADGKLTEFSTFTPYIDMAALTDNSFKSKWEQLEEIIDTMSEAQKEDMRFAGAKALSPRSNYSAENWVQTITRYVIPA